MNYIVYNHNFCESRLQGLKPPELLNAYSSFFISLIPVILGIPNNKQNFKNVSYLLILNGFCSFYFHYSLSWFGKHLDEVTMILSNYFGICELLNINYLQNSENLKIINLIFMSIFISFNTLPQYDFLFPYIFGFYALITVCLIKKASKLCNLTKTTNAYLLYSLFGAIAWIISENICSETTKYGHVFWHIMFPFGFYRILILYDNIF